MDLEVLPRNNGPWVRFRKKAALYFAKKTGRNCTIPNSSLSSCISPQPLLLLPFDRYVFGNVIVQRPPRLFPSFPDPRVRNDIRSTLPLNLLQKSFWGDGRKFSGTLARVAVVSRIFRLFTGRSVPNPGADQITAPPMG
jgi:hypothetical protein